MRSVVEPGHADLERPKHIGCPSKHLPIRTDLSDRELCTHVEMSSWPVLTESVEHGPWDLTIIIPCKGIQLTEFG